MLMLVEVDSMDRTYRKSSSRGAIQLLQLTQGDICCASYPRSTLVAREKSAGTVKACRSDLHISRPAGGSVRHYITNMTGIPEANRKVRGKQYPPAAQPV